MDIKEIALKVGAQGLPIEGTAHKFCVLDFCSKEVLIKFAEALIAEIAKQNEPCVFLHEWIEYHPFGDTHAGKRCAAITSDEKPFDSSDTVSPLFTFPPTAEQIANETAEACAKYVNCFLNGDGIQDEAWIRDIESGIRRGAWKEFKK